MTFIGHSYYRSGGAWVVSQQLFQPGKVWIRQGGVWVSVVRMSFAGGQENVGTPLDPVWNEDWYQLFNNVTPSVAPTNASISADDHNIINPAGTYSTATVGWSDNVSDPTFQMGVNWYVDGVIAASSGFPAVNNTGRSPAIYHTQWDDGTPATTMQAELFWNNPYAAPGSQDGPSTFTDEEPY